eukprot:gene208-688_t
MLGKVANQFHEHLKNSCVHAHRKISELLLDKRFIEDHGFYYISESWLDFALDKVLIDQENTGSSDFNISLFAAAYAYRFRHAEVQTKVKDIVFGYFSQGNNSLREYEDQLKNFGRPDKPFVFTPRHVDVFQLLLRLLRVQQPVLLVGEDGVGKTEMVLALSRLLNISVSQLFLTQDTDPSELIGSVVPVEGQSDAPEDENSTGERFQWQDGIIPRCARVGHWALLDNLGSTDPCVNERLNPIAEQPPDVILSEKGDSKIKVDVHNDFRLFATATKGKSLDQGISPALLNRFSIVDMAQPSMTNEANFMTEWKMIAKCLLPSLPDQNAYEISAKLCWNLWKNQKNIRGLTPSVLINMLDTAQDIHRQFHDWSELAGWKKVLEAAFTVSRDGLFNEHGDDFLSKLVGKVVGNSGEKPKFLQHMGDENEKDHVLPKNRTEHAERCAAAVLFNRPVLLEGPPAVGKTKLVEHFAQNFKTDQRSKRELMRMNNTQSTTLQDYYGTLIPKGGEFNFEKGDLTLALEEGHWFLADELNLADPAVLSALTPLLEGRSEINIPGYKTITVDPQFRFFATQNPQGTSGRNRLDKSFLNHFMKVRVGEFEPEDLVEILVKRKDKIASDSVQPADAKRQADVYIRMRNAGEFDITFRDLIKWRRRHSYFNSLANCPTTPRRASDLSRSRRSKHSNWGVVGYQMFSQGCVDDQARANLHALFSDIYNGVETIELECTGSCIRL